MKMRAAVIYEQGLPKPYRESAPFKIEEVDLEGPGEGEVLVEIRAAGLCHSDLSQVAGIRTRILPYVGGHEGAGIVRDVGSGVRSLRAGDHVVMSVAGGCGRCSYCADARPVLCDHQVAPRQQGLLTTHARRLSLRGKPIYHYSGISAFAEYAVVAEEALVRIDPDVPLDIAAMFGCAVLTGVGAVLNAAKVRPGDNVAIFGLGGVGLCTVMAAKLAGASEIIGIDINPDKFELAMAAGCTRVLSATDPVLVEAIRSITSGGVDFAFEISGAKAAMVAAGTITRKGAEIVGVGLGGGWDELYSYPHAQWVAQEKVFRGSLMGSGHADRDIPLYLKFYREGRLPIDLLKSSTVSFAEFNESLDHLDTGSAVRQILLPYQ